MSKGKSPNSKRKDGAMEKFQDWICQYHDYWKVEGIHTPFYAEAGWNSEAEESKYAKFRIEQIEYGKPFEFL